MNTGSRLEVAGWAARLSLLGLKSKGFLFSLSLFPPACLQSPRPPRVKKIPGSAIRPPSFSFTGPSPSSPFFHLAPPPQPHSSLEPEKPYKQILILWRSTEQEPSETDRNSGLPSSPPLPLSGTQDPACAYTTQGRRAYLGPRQRMPLPSFQHI